MHHHALFSSVFVASALGIPADERASLQADLDQWRATFGRDAAANGLLPQLIGLDEVDATELLLSRLQAAKAALPALRRENPDADFTHLGPFALLSHDEFRQRLGRSFAKAAPKRALRPDAVDYGALPAATAAGNVDWATRSRCVNRVKDQGGCGSCWAFAATGAIESAHCIATGALLNLSEQQVVSCDTIDGNGGCDGGREVTAINWVASRGQCVTRDYPYMSGASGSTGACQTTCSPQTLAVGGAIQIVGEAALETALNTQPATVSVAAGNEAWQYYSGGIVTSCPDAISDHAVIAVGYGTSSGKSFFKLRNSWGAAWGEAGYIKLQRGVGGKGTCNVAERPAYPKIYGAANLVTATPTATPEPTTLRPWTNSESDGDVDGGEYNNSQKPRPINGK